MIVLQNYKFKSEYLGLNIISKRLEFFLIINI